MSDYADNLRRSMINKTRRFMRMVQEMQEKDDAALREQVIRMAREAGIDAESDTLCRYEGWVEPLQRFFHLAAAAGAEAEREACARVEESLGPIDYPITAALYHGNVADAIRARGRW